MVGRDGVLLAAEVPEERAPPDPGRGGDVVDRGVVVAAGVEQLDRGGDQVAPQLRPARRRPTPPARSAMARRVTGRLFVALSAVKVESPAARPRTGR